MKMNLLSGGRLRMRRSVYIPDSDRSETIDLPVSCALLRHEKGNVLFDTGCHPSTATDAAARWGAMAKAMVPIGGPEDHVLAGLAGLGLGPEDIDIVVNSHFHSDHCGCNEFFTRATVICHRRELEVAQGPEAVQRGYIPADWQTPMPTQVIESQHDVFGDGRLVLLPLPGHTPGTLGALVETGRDGSFLLAADAIPLAYNLEREVLPRNTWDSEQAMNSLQEVRRVQASGATVVYGHDAAQWSALRTGTASYG